MNMNLLAYWRIDNYRRDLEEGAGFHFNSKQSRLHTAIGLGETLWLFTRLVGPTGLSEYRVLAKLIVRAKAINSPSYQYGPFRIWGDLQLSQYYRVTNNPLQDAFELLRLLPLDSGSFKDCNRSNIANAAQTIRALKPEASNLLRSFCDQLPPEPQARAVPDERKLEVAYNSGAQQLRLLLQDSSLAYSTEKRAELIGSYPRNRQLVEDLNRLYAGRCQLCSFDSRTIYSVESAEAHHIVYRSRGGADSMENLLLLCPNHHTIIHRADATFDYAKLHFSFPNGRIEPICLNQHLQARQITYAKSRTT